MSQRFPAWVGWPGTGPAPGHEWLPGKKLRIGILLLTYVFFTLALSVNYVYSVTFFLLAILGMYVGLRRGFVNGLTRAEKVIMLFFVAYPTVQIASYLLGTQTNVGFRFLGRDLRLLLFLPVYVCVRWSFPKRIHLALALGAGAIAAFVLAVMQFWLMAAGGQPPQGVAGTHIVFGDLALLCGCLSGMLLIAERRTGWWLPLSAAVISSGVGTCVLSLSRGGWVAIPFLMFFLISVLPYRWRWRALWFSIALAIGAVVGVGAFLPKVVNRAETALEHGQALARFGLNKSYSELNSAACPNTLPFMRALSTVIDVHPLQAKRLLEIKADPLIKQMRSRRMRCRSDYVFEVAVPKSIRAVWVGVRRHVEPGGYQRAAILVRGKGQVGVYNVPPVTVDSPTTYRLQVLGGRDLSSNPFLHIWVQAGGRIRFVPIQLHRGEYTQDVITTSIGSRLIMWWAALHAFVRHPLLGTGTGTFQYVLRASPVAAALVDAGKLYQHPHNDVLNALYASGLFGLAVLAALYMLFFLPSGDRIATRVSQATGTALIIFGLSESMLIHSFVITYWVMLSAILLATRTQAYRAGGDRIRGASLGT